MQGSRTALREAAPRVEADCYHVLVVIKHADLRRAVIDQLRQATLRVTTVPTLDLVDILSDSGQSFDLLVTAQSPDEMAQFGLPQLARSVRPALPILLLDTEAARGSGTALAAIGTIAHWPVPERQPRRLH